MAGLPPRPEFHDYPPSRRSYQVDDRYSSVSRPIPMAPPDRYSYARHDERDARERDDRAHWPPRSPPRVRYAADHVEYGYDSRMDRGYHDAAYRHPEWSYRDREREREIDARTWEREHDSRRTWVAEPDRRDDRRDWGREGDRGRDWERSDYPERRRIYDRERDYDPRRADDRQWHRDAQHSDHRRESRASVSPPRRIFYPAETSNRHPSRSPRRGPSPSPVRSHRGRSRHPSPARSATRSISRAPSPLKGIKLGNHSISSSPRVHDRRDRHFTPKGQEDDRWRPRRHSRSVSPPRRTSLTPASRSPERTGHSEHQEVRSAESVKGEPSPSPLVQHHSDIPPADTNVSEGLRSRSRSLTPAKPEPIELSIRSIDEPQDQPDKGKAKEEPQNTDTIMRDPSPPLPKQPQAPPALPTQPRMYQRSPPRGPRHYVKTPTSPASPASFHQQALPVKPEWSRRDTTTPGSAPTLAHPDIPKKEPETLVVALPIIPVYKPKPSLIPELEADLLRIQAHRAHITSEYTQISKATRRALHELDIAAIDLRAAENRRKVASAQMEKARAGVLGIDAVQLSS